MNTEITRTDIAKGYENLKKCIDVYLERNQIAFLSSHDAPNSYKKMVESRDRNGTFCVYNGGDHGLLGMEYNIKFRALHDFGHYTNKLSFKFEQEKRLSNIQSAELALIAWNDIGLTAWECLVIKSIVTAEIKGQIEYYEKNSKYVENQTEFIYSFFKV